MLGMLIYSKEKNCKLEKNILAGTELFTFHNIYNGEILKEILNKQGVLDEKDKNKIILLMLSPWFARNIDEIKNIITMLTKLFDFRYSKKYIKYVEAIYHMIHQNEEELKNILENLSDDKLFNILKESKKFNDYDNLTKNLNRNESLILCNMLDAYYKKIDKEYLNLILKDHYITWDNERIMINYLTTRYYLFNNQIKISTNTKLICLETTIKDETYLDWYFNNDLENLKKNMIYNILGDIIDSEYNPEIKLSLMLEDYDDYLYSVGLFFMLDSDQYKLLLDIKDYLPLIFNNDDENFNKGLRIINEKLAKYEFNEKFIYFDTVDKALQYLNKKYKQNLIDFNRIFEQRHYLTK